jgi:predicted alpha-1,2-mannosidase
VDAYLKGMPNVDWEKAYAAIRASSVISHPNSPFEVLDKYGYFPEDVQTQSVSIAVETAFDDWCVAQMAQKMGKQEDYAYFSKRSEYYKNMFDKNTGFFRGKNKDGKWIEPFDPLSYGGNGGFPFTEGNAWQYLWFVPQDVPAMMQLFGSREQFCQKLDKFFTLKEYPKEMNGNASGFIGQYAHGNEPSHHCAYLYVYGGQPWKTQFYVQKIMNELYDNSPAGLCGNEDCGQMSAWYVFSAMGFYPVNPTGGKYILGSPALKKTVLSLENGNVFTVLAPNVSDKNIYIKAVKLNDKIYDKAYIMHQDIMKGGKLEFIMDSKPNTKWCIHPEAVI